MMRRKEFYNHRITYEPNKGDPDYPWIVWKGSFDLTGHATREEAEEQVEIFKKEDDAELDRIMGKRR